MSRLYFCLIAMSFSIISIAAQAALQLPTTPVVNVVDEIQGTKISDPYRWLEDASNPKVQKWTQQQAAYARAYLDRLPKLAAIKATLKSWNDFQSSSYYVTDYKAGMYFAMKLQPPKNQSALVVLTSVDDLKSERTILDPNVLDPSGTTAIDFVVPSLDGRYVAVSLSKGGSEVGTLHIYRTVDGQETGDQIANVNKPTAGGSVAWNQDSSGIYYTRYPRTGERAAVDLDFYQQVYFHKLGTGSAADSYSLGRDFPRIAEIRLTASRDGKWVLATVSNGDGGDYAHYVLGSSGKWNQITKFEDNIKQAEFGLHDDLYLVSLNGAPRGKILHLPLLNPELAKAEVAIVEDEGVVRELLPTKDSLYVDYLIGGPSIIKAYSLDGKKQQTLATIPNSDSDGLMAAANDGVLFRTQSYTVPAAWYEFHPSVENVIHKTAMIKLSPVDFSDIEVVRELALSKDGTKVPVTILYKKGTKKNGKNPTLLYGYGGYGISLAPRYSADMHFWLEHGGVYAVANIRGGGEFGEAWHKQGNLTKKQNVFDDFIASAQHLIDAGYTTKAHLAIEGGSNGGLLMGAALTQRPDLFRAVVSHVGIYDMLRVENDANGAFNVTEFGTRNVPDQFKALNAYSPYHHVTARVAYPATMLLTGANDGRVNPYHSKKMAARLQAVNHDRPTLLRVTFDGGHGIGRSVAQKVNEEADVYAFLFSQLGIKN